MTLAVYERTEKIWASFQKRAKEDEEATKQTLHAIYGGLSKSMQAQYSMYKTPASLWEELKRTKDLSNRKLDTSAADTYRTMEIAENQLIPDYLKRICEAEDACTAAAQRTVCLRLDYCLAQAGVVISALPLTNLADLEKNLIDLWDGYKAALSRNAPKETKVNVTIGNPDRKRKHDNKGKGKGKQSRGNRYSGKNANSINLESYKSFDIHDVHACKACTAGKFKRAKVGSEARTTTINTNGPGEMLHVDVAGPFNDVFHYNGQGYRYFLLVVDDFSRFSFLRILIVVETIAVNYPHMDGVAERYIGQTKTIAKMIHLHANFPPKLWGYSVIMANKLCNLWPQRHNKWESSFWRFYKSKPEIQL
ncbi:hypothetical protein HDU80_009695 [Chytriomyces hyalinus]|nr:hypothetical protein HDU80_009695 [Chytriomyces hyalinus]